MCPNLDFLLGHCYTPMILSPDCYLTLHVSPNVMYKVFGHMHSEVSTSGFFHFAVFFFFIIAKLDDMDKPFAFEGIFATCHL